MLQQNSTIVIQTLGDQQRAKFMWCESEVDAVQLSHREMKRRNWYGERARSIAKVSTLNATLCTSKAPPHMWAIADPQYRCCGSRSPEIKGTCCSSEWSRCCEHSSSQKICDRHGLTTVVERWSDKAWTCDMF